MRRAAKAPAIAIFSLAQLVLAAAVWGLPLALTVPNDAAHDRKRVPVSWGIPLAAEEGIYSAAELRLHAGGSVIPAQFTVLARWAGAPADSTRPVAWLLIDAQLDLTAAGAELSLSQGGASPPADAVLRVLENSPARVMIDTGAGVFTVVKNPFRLISSVSTSGGDRAQEEGILLNGTAVAAPAAVTVEHEGGERISLLARGAIAGGLNFTCRLHFFRRLTDVRIDFRLENVLEPVTVDGQPQANNYGSADSWSMDDLTLVFPALPEKRYVMPTGELGADGSEAGAFASAMSIFQGSSGDPNWNALAGAARLQGGVAQRPSTVLRDGTAAAGPNQIAGWLRAGGTTVGVQRAWQNFPKALRARSGAVEAGLFPGEFSRNHELRAGEHKTHTVWVSFEPPDGESAAARARSLLQPARILPSPQYISQALRVGVTGPLDSRHFAYERGVELQLRAPAAEDQRECAVRGLECRIRDWENPSTSIFDAVSRNQLYGWADFGDIPTDFESNPHYPYNLKYDAVRGALLHALRRTGSAAAESWWEFGEAAARHAADIDIQHSLKRGRESARQWFQGGMYGHLYHDEGPQDGENPHRNLGNPSAQVSGPIPGIFLYALLSGDTLALDAANEAADNLFWRAKNSYYRFYDEDGAVSDYSSEARLAGLQNCAGEEACAGYEPVFGSRGAGNVAAAMLAAFAATGETDYLALISQLVSFVNRFERSIPRFDERAYACNRFHFETIFIKAIGDYLLHLQAAGLPEDAEAREYLSRRMSYLKERLWKASAAPPLRICYVNDQAGERLMDFVTEAELERSSDFVANNWLLSAADALAAGALILNQPSLLSEYGDALFTFGSENQFYSGSSISYHSTKEFVNQIGFGHTYLFAQRALGLTPDPPAGTDSCGLKLLNGRRLRFREQRGGAPVSGLAVTFEYRPRRGAFRTFKTGVTNAGGVCTVGIPRRLRKGGVSFRAGSAQCAARRKKW